MPGITTHNDNESDIALFDAKLGGGGGGLKSNWVLCCNIMVEYSQVLYSKKAPSITNV